MSKKNFLRVAIIANENSKEEIKKESTGFQTKADGTKVIGAIIITMLNIKVIIFSSFESFFTRRPAQAWVNADIKARILPNSTFASGLIIKIIRINPKHKKKF